MADPLSTAASVAGLVSLAIQLSQLSFQYVSSIKGSSKSWSSYIQELSALTSVLLKVQHASDGIKNLHAVIAGPGISGATVRECEAELGELKTILSEKLQKRGIRGKLDMLAWPFSEADTDKRVQTLHRFSALFSSSLIADNLNLSIASYRRLQNIKDVNEIKDLLSWLEPKCAVMSLETIAEDICPGTRTAIVSSAEYLDWRDGRTGSRVIWARGPPGCGKTHLSAAIADELLNNCPKATLSYHFFRDDHVEPLADVLRHLAYQHLSQPTGTSKLAINLHQKSKATKAPLLPKDLAKILCDIASTSHCTYIVLDGVDEFPYAGKLMKHFPDFVAAGARLFIAGRDIPSISASLACTNPLTLDARADQADISAYVGWRLQEDSELDEDTFNDELLKEICKKLVDHADGSFLLARLLMDQICRVTTVKKLRKTLESLPINYDEAYKNTLDRISKQDRERHELARHAMHWVCSSHRPLDMTELQHAIASLNEDESSYGKEDLATEKSILSACLGLLTQSKASGIVGLVHSSARDVILGQLRLNNQSSEIRIGKACLRYMSSPEMAKGPCLSLQGLKTRLITMPFLEYSTRHYGYHVRPLQNELLTELMAFLGDENLREAAWQLLHFIFNIDSDSAQGVVESMPKGASILHVACYWGFASVLEQFLSAKPNADVLNFPDSHGWTGLHWAASTGHADIAGRLLDAGTNLEAVDRGNWTPLFWAVVKGHEPVVSLLLEREANMFHVDGSHFTPLHWSVLSGAKNITALLLERGEDIRPSHIMFDEKSVPARSLSVEQAKALEAPVKFKNLFELTLQTSDIGGFEQLASSFKPYSPFGYHEAGLNLEKFDQAWDRTKMVLSKSEGLLLRQNTDTTPIDAVRRRLLVTAIQCEDLETVKSIVQLSMDMNKDLFTEVVTGQGASYVHVAAYSASSEIMQLLIDKGFPLEVKDKKGMTPLHYACRTGTRQIIEMLLKAGVDVDAKVGAQVECTALMLLLHFGAQRTCESPGEALDLVQTLVASGASVHARDSGGNTVMHHAMMCLDPTVVQALLNLGADLSTPNDYGETPLHTLAGGDSEDRKVSRIDPCWEGFHQRDFYLGVPSHDLKAAVVKLVLQAFPARALTATTRNGNSALALAIQKEKWILTQALYKADAPFLFTGDLSACLQGVSAQGFYEIVRLLVRHGARPNAKNLVAYICVHVPGQKPHPWTRTRSSLDDNVDCFPLRDDALTIRELLGVEVEETEKIYLPKPHSGFSTIQIAAERGVDARIVEALLEGGADPYAQTETGMDSFLFALVCGKQDNLEILLDHAIADTHPRAHWLTDYLRNPDANLQLPSSDIYLSALQHAGLIYCWDMEGHTLLFHAITESNPVLANNLLARGADPNAADPFGWTPVHEAVRTENVALLKLLLAHGGDVFATVSDVAPFSASRATSALDYQYPDAAAINALHLAAGCNPHPDDMEERARLSPDMVRLLLELGFDPNGKTRNTGDLLQWTAKEGGETPLDIMFWDYRFSWDERFFEVVEMLVDKGAEVGRVVDKMKVWDVVQFEGREGLWDRFRAAPSGFGKEKLAEWVDALDVD